MMTAQELLNFVISQGGSFQVAHGKVSIGLSDRSVQVNMPQMFYYDFDQGLEEIKWVLESTVESYQADKEVEEQVKNILLKEGFHESFPAYRKFSEVLRYLIVNKVDLSGEYP